MQSEYPTNESANDRSTGSADSVQDLSTSQRSDDGTWITRLDPSATGDSDPNELRLAVKDCIDVAGTVTTVGCPSVAESAEAATSDALCLAGFRQAGVRLVGKTGLHELCFGSSGVNVHYGTPTNPIDPRRVPGGSSSGSAVAVARAEADIALGTDTAGSIRNPAACCGVVGLKPTNGVVPVEGTWPLAPSLDAIGVFARDVSTIAVAATMLNPSLVEGDLGTHLRIGRLRFEGTDPTIDAAIDSALIDAGLEVVEVSLPGWEQAHKAGMTILFGEALLVNEQLWRTKGKRFGADLIERFTAAEKIAPDQMGQARAHRELWRQELAEVFGEVDVLAAPTMLTYPPRIGEHVVAPNPTGSPVNLAGHPALALPLPSGGLMPASVQLIAPDHQESRLLGAAAVIEAAVR